MTDEEAKTLFNKGWSFFNVYSIRELRDIFILCRYNLGLTLSQFTSIVEKNIEFEEREWTERRVLEILNALKNIKLLDLEGKPLADYFSIEQLNKPLTDIDKTIFEQIFFSYFRFKELSSWFISPEKEFHKEYFLVTKERLINESRPLYFFSNNSRFTNNFVYSIEDQPAIRYVIEDHMSHLMRFWDVYLKWGTTLGVLEKFSLSVLHVKIDKTKDVTTAYFIKPFKKFDFLGFLSKHFDSRSIFIPQLIFEIAQVFKYSVIEIKNFIIEEIKQNDSLTYERTSEIFIIKGRESKRKIREATYLYPQIDNNYISHLIIRK